MNSTLGVWIRIQAVSEQSIWVSAMKQKGSIVAARENEAEGGTFKGN